MTAATDELAKQIASSSSAACDIVALGAHPDDVEIGCGGTLLSMRAAGHTVGAVDMTRGELGTRGTKATRAAECETATKQLGLTTRLNLALPDGGVNTERAAIERLVAALRLLRPKLLLSHLERDVHPDHGATARLTREAWFRAGLAKFAPELGAPHRPTTVLYYPGNDSPPQPTVCVDISDTATEKSSIVRCYSTQVNVGDTKHLARGLNLLDRMTTRDAFYGSMIGVRAAEAFVAEGPLRLQSLQALLPR